MELFLAFHIFFACLSGGLVRAENSVCDAIYLRFSNEHTICKSKNPSCAMVRNGVSDAEKEAILKAHNDYRMRIATGQETDFPLPQAKNMLEMVWDDELATIAQSHADQCKFNHDCNDCREVRSFGVGQNLFTLMHPTDAPQSSSWPLAVKTWYDEVKDFDKALIPKYQMVGGPDTGHFTQVAWADSWRLGCGYSVYKEGNGHSELYTCNYGPGGNMMDSTMYDEGDSCSGCPENSCCGDQCKEHGHPGLCQILGNVAPKYKHDTSANFWCTFSGESDCDMEITAGENSWWETHNTLGGGLLGIVLKGGQASTVNFTTPIKGSGEVTCVQITYRKGPHASGAQQSHKAVEIFTDPATGQSMENELPATHGATFMPFGFGYPGSNFKLSIGFSVSPGGSPQYLEIKEIKATAGECQY